MNSAHTKGVLFVGYSGVCCCSMYWPMIAIGATTRWREIRQWPQRVTPAFLWNTGILLLANHATRYALETINQNQDRPRWRSCAGHHSPLWWTRHGGIWSRSHEDPMHRPLL